MIDQISFSLPRRAILRRRRRPPGCLLRLQLKPGSQVRRFTPAGFAIYEPANRGGPTHVCRVRTCVGPCTLEVNLQCDVGNASAVPSVREVPPASVNRGVRVENSVFWVRKPCRSTDGRPRRRLSRSWPRSCEFSRPTKMSTSKYRHRGFGRRRSLYLDIACPM